MRKQMLALMLGLAGSAPIFAIDTYQIDSRHAFPIFEVNHLGFSTQRGRFNKTSGEIKLDRATKQGSVEVVIDTTSLDMGFEEWDKHVGGEGFFDVEKYPTMKFRSDRFIFDGDNLVGAEGMLTLLGVSKPVKLDIAHFKCAHHPMTQKLLCAADISATIRRSEWGMTKYVPVISDEVKINIPIEAYKQ